MWKEGQIVTVDGHKYKVTKSHNYTRCEKCGYEGQKWSPCVMHFWAHNRKFTKEDCAKNIPNDCYLEEIKDSSVSE